MLCYHRTAAADAILRDGFRDAEGFYMMALDEPLRGVFISDEPLDVNEGAKGDELLEVGVPDDLDLSQFELVEDGKGYREWCVPAELLNSRSTVRRVSEEEEDELALARARARGWPG